VPNSSAKNASGQKPVDASQMCFQLKWIERVGDSRALTVTPAGRRGLLESFGISA
jgi:hypothetical protein